MAEPIRIIGLREFRDILKRVDAELPKGLRTAHNAAAQLVVDYARPRVPSRSGRARKSVKTRSTRLATRVSGGGPRAVYYPWLDFGGRVGPRKSVVRRFIKEGRYIYDGYYTLSASGRFQEVLTEAFVDLARAAGLEVTETSE